MPRSRYVALLVAILVFVYSVSVVSLGSWKGVALAINTKGAGKTTLISRHTEGTLGNEDSFSPSVSGDGRYVVFSSYANNLVDDDRNDPSNVFIHDRDTDEDGIFDESGARKTVVIASHKQNPNLEYSAGSPSITPDGRYVVFISRAKNTNISNIFVHDRDSDGNGVFDESGAVVATLVSVHQDGTSANDDSFYPSITPDGRYVVFDSTATNLVDEDDNNATDVFVHDRDTDEDGIFDEPGYFTTMLVSRNIDGVQGDDDSYWPSISADGRVVAFNSKATNLTPDNNQHTWDVFAHDRQTGQTSLVSRRPDGTPLESGSNFAGMSQDGRYIAFTSSSTGLVDDSYDQGLFVHDRQNGNIALISRHSNGTPGDGYSTAASFSAEGRFVAFSSRAPNLVDDDNNSTWDVFVHDRDTDGNGAYDEPGHIRTTLVSRHPDGNLGNANSLGASISANAMFVAFVSNASNLVDADENDRQDVFIHKLTPSIPDQEGGTTLISRHTDGTLGNSGTFNPSISADGQFIAFDSHASNLVDNDTSTGGSHDVFIHNKETGETILISRHTDGTQSEGHSSEPSISANGRFVAFQSWADNLVNDDTNNINHIFVHDRETGETALVSRHTDGTLGNDGSFSPSISADGRFVAFISRATNLVDDIADNVYLDRVYVYDRQTGETALVSRHTDGTPGDNGSFEPAISQDGRYVAFSSYSSNLVEGDSTYSDVFVHDRQTGITTLVSRHANGTPGEGQSGTPSISADGRYVAFSSWARNLVDDATNGVSQVFVHDRQTSETTLVSRHSDGTVGTRKSLYTSISADGRYIAFGSEAENLVDNDSNEKEDVFVHDRWAGKTTLVSRHTDGTPGNDNSSSPAISSGGQFVTFSSLASSLVDDDDNQTWDVFVHDFLSAPPTLIDTDGDALPDLWEMQGLDTDGDGNIDVDLPAMDADPNKPDIFIEVDWMKNDDHSHQPDPAAIERVVQAFQEAPHGGINLHVDAGPNSIDYVSGKHWGENSRGNAIDHIDVLGADDDLLQSVNKIIEQHFDVSRSQVFHYSIWGHRFELNGNTRRSGASLGNDYQVFLVTLGAFDRGVGSEDQQAGTFMHELGHNLGLLHGGNDDINHKPNYLSVMNYLFQMNGLIIDGDDGHLDYSRWDLPTLDEESLNEPNGIMGGEAVNRYGTKFHVSFPYTCFPDANPMRADFFAIAERANGPVNWDCDFGIDTDPVREDANGDGEISAMLHSYNDWDNLDFAAGGIGQAGAPPPTEIPPEAISKIAEELTPEDNVIIQRVIDPIFLPFVTYTNSTRN